MMKKYAIIAAGGLGSRMKNRIPKQFLTLGNEPVIIHTIRKFLEAEEGITIIVVIPAGAENAFRKIQRKFFPDRNFVVCPGGQTRFQSVKNGLREIIESGIVAIHDAARPLASTALIRKCFRVAAKKGNAVPVTDITDSIRVLRGSSSKPADRNNFCLVQTPQCFSTEILKQAYSKFRTGKFSDDAQVIEAVGIPVCLVAGEPTNIKITKPEDLKIAAALMSQ